MTIEKLNDYENAIFGFISKYNRIFKKVIKASDVIFNFTVKLIEIFLIITSEVLNLTGKIMRYTTFPFHWLWINKILKKEKEQKLTDLRLFEMGGHYIHGLPKAGKSSVVYHAMMDYAYYTGKTSYTTQIMEKKRKDIYGNEYYLHQLFHPSEFYADGEQINAFDTEKHNIVVYEEMLQHYHQRNNSKNSHNDEVIPMVASMGGQRHQGIDMFYFISQLPTNDISLMQMLRGYHKVQIVFRFDYKNWLNTGKFKFKVKGWKIESSRIQPVGRSDYKLVDTINWFYKARHFDDMEYFETYNLKEVYAKLPKHKGVEMN